MEPLVNSIGASQEALDTVVAAYRENFEHLLADLSDRLKRRRNGDPWGGVLSRQGRAEIASIRMDALQQIKLELDAMAPDVAAKLAESLKGTIDTETRQWLLRTASHAPDYARANFTDILKNKTYIKNGSMLQRKIERFLGAPKPTGRGWASYIRMPNGQIPINARLLQKINGHLLAGFNSGKSWDAIATDLEKNVYGFDIQFQAGEKGFFGEAQRLLRTESAYWHNSGRHDAIKENPACIGYEIELDDEACEECVALYGKRFFYYDKDGELTPPDESHPNCRCTIVAPIYMRMEEFLRQSG